MKPASLEWIRPSIYALLLAALLLAQVRCSNPTTGVLEVEVSGLPAGVDAAVTVQGPGNYSEALTASQNTTLSAGQYTVSASSVTSGGKVYTAVVSGSPATVAVGSPATVSVVYSTPAVGPGKGSLAIGISGLPAGTDADVTVAGGESSESFTANVTASQTLGDLMPGSYTITANAVSVGGTSYLPTVTGSPAAVTAGGTASASVSYAAAAPTTGSLQISIAGLPAGTGANVSVAGPGGYAQSLQSSQTLGSLAPGSYTLTAQSVTSSSTTYLATVTGSPAAVVAGSTATASVTYATMVAVLPAPTITSVTPAIGVESTGGTLVDIYGTNFVSGGTQVTVGGVSVSTVNFFSTTQLSVTAPPHAVGLVDVVVTTAGGSSAITVADKLPYFHFDYFPLSTEVSAGGMVAGPDGNIWFTERSRNKVAMITPAGAITEYTLPTAIGDPVDIAAGADGNLWFTDYYSSHVGNITTGGTITEFPLPSGCNSYGISPGPGSEIWFTEFSCPSGSSNKVGKIETAAPYTVTEYELPTTPYPLATGMGLGPDGNVWWCDFDSSQIGTITASGEVRNYDLTGYQPGFLTTGPDGKLWFTGPSSHGGVLGSLSTNGIYTPHTISDGSAISSHIAKDANGVWYAGSELGFVNTSTLAAVVYPARGALTGVAVAADQSIWFMTEGYDDDMHSAIGHLTR